MIVEFVEFVFWHKEDLAVGYFSRILCAGLIHQARILDLIHISIRFGNIPRTIQVGVQGKKDNFKPNQNNVCHCLV
jgi:hypothetical protein